LVLTEPEGWSDEAASAFVSVRCCSAVEFEHFCYLMIWNSSERRYQPSVPLACLHARSIIQLVTLASRSGRALHLWPCGSTMTIEGMVKNSHRS
jgi:hypothetical protein